MNLPKSNSNLEKKPNHIELRLKSNERSLLSGRSDTSPQGLRATSQEYQMPTPIFYNPTQNVVGVSSYSPSAGKPARFAELMAHYDFRSYGNGFSQVYPVEKDDLYLVHDRRYIDDLFALRAPNGFNNYHPEIPNSLLWTVGSMLTASRFAMVNPHLPACAPVSGFHHASFGEPSGFCSVNGLMIVAAKLLSEKPDLRICVIDADAHYADGTVDILSRFPLLNKQVLHFTAGQYFHGDNPREDALEFQAWLRSAIAETNAFKPDLVLYQAGADSHVNDDLKGGYLTSHQMQQRDRAVFRGVKAPLVFNLAGGYQKPTDGTIFTDPVLQLHRTTIMEANTSVAHRIELLKETK